MKSFAQSHEFSKSPLSALRLVVFDVVPCPSPDRSSPMEGGGLVLWVYFIMLHTYADPINGGRGRGGKRALEAWLWFGSIGASSWPCSPCMALKGLMVLELTRPGPLSPFRPLPLWSPSSGLHILCLGSSPHTSLI